MVCNGKHRIILMDGISFQKYLDRLKAWSEEKQNAVQEAQVKQCR